MKNNIFKHELNDSIQVKATLNCLSNRNKKHLKESIGEVYPDSRWGEKERLNGPNGMSKSERDVLIKLEQIMPNLVQKAMDKASDHDNPDEIKKLVLNMIMQGNLMQKLGDKVGASWKEFSMGFKSEIINLVKNEFAKHEEQEEQIFKVRTKQGFVEVPLSSEVVDAFHDNLDPRYENMDTQAALKGINGGARLASLITGMMEQGYKPTSAELHILELHYNAKNAVKQSQADSSNRNINAYSD